MRNLLVIGAVVVGLAAGGVTSGVLASSGPPAADHVAGASATGDKDAAKDAAKTKDKTQDKTQKAFVQVKKAWTACRSETAPGRGRNQMALDQACGAKPHPHDLSGKPGREGGGRPPWAGGPERRSAEPPGHARSN